MWAAARYRSSRGNYDWSPCAVQLPVTPFGDGGAAFVIADADGTILGGVVGEVQLLAGVAPCNSWVEAVDEARKGISPARAAA